jgi:N-acetylneuraminate synthase
MGRLRRQVFGGAQSSSGDATLARDRVIVIAEAGVNHNGSVDLAIKLVDAAAEAGADYVKFQTFRAEAVVTRAAPKAAYQDRNAPGTRTQFEMLKALELSSESHRVLQKRCQERKIKFLSTAFDSASVSLLADELKLPVIKVSSGDLTNAPLLVQLARSQANLILSTGMATVDEIETALGVVAFGYLETGTPTLDACRSVFSKSEARELLARKVTLLHCTSDYPARVADVNLRAMDTLSTRFRLPVGYSDHTEGTLVSVLAVAHGACMIEKHMTLDRKMEGPDHKASLEPAEMKSMIDQIRLAEVALGSPEKAPTEAEFSTRRVARKRVVAARFIAAGEPFSPGNLTTKRTDTGLEPIMLWQLIGRPAARDYQPDESIDS